MAEEFSRMILKMQYGANKKIRKLSLALYSIGHLEFFHAIFNIVLSSRPYRENLMTSAFILKIHIFGFDPAFM